VIIVGTMGAEFTHNPDGVFMGNPKVEEGIRQGLLQLHRAILEVTTESHVGIYRVVASDRAAFTSPLHVSFETVEFDYPSGQVLFHPVSVVVKTFG
jgi:hypothetical protein